MPQHLVFVLINYFHVFKLDIIQVLNQIVYELPAEHPLAESRPLRELLGHTPPQVCFITSVCIL
jgi:acid phosphatase family membrane protein YuiD